jgi:small subunit ribosomal protein S6
MRRYELMVILDPSLDERTVSPSLEQFLARVRDILETRPWEVEL